MILYGCIPSFFWRKMWLNQFAYTQFTYTQFAYTQFAYTQFAYTQFAYTQFAYTQFACTQFAYTQFAYTQFAFTRSHCFLIKENNRDWWQAASCVFPRNAMLSSPPSIVSNLCIHITSACALRSERQYCD